MADARQTKRRKTLLACEYCRNKKTKCDGERPVCGACAKRGWNSERCLWKHVDGREDTVPMSLVRDLERRILELERQGPVQLTDMPTILTPGAALTSSAPASSLPANSPHGLGPSPNSISAMEGAVTGEPQDEGYVGPAAAAAFINTVRCAVDPQSAARPTAVRRPEVSGIQYGKAISTSHALPLQQEANVLVQSYWTFVHPIYPFLYKPAFEAIYTSLWSGAPVSAARLPIMQTSYNDNVCLVFLVLSLGCQYALESDFDHDIRQGSRQAEAYFQRARAAFHYDLLDEKPPTLQRAQILLLMAQYLKSIGSTHKAWDVIGLAIRTSQRLGLHLPATSSIDAMVSFTDREIVKRVWHGCVMTERMLSATLGRPAMISATEVVPLPFPLEVDEDLFQSGRLGSSEVESASSSTKSAISFFILSVELFEIVQRILLAFYSDSQGDVTDDHSQYFTGTDSVFALDSQMMKWRKGVPPHLRLDDGDGSRAQDSAARTSTRQAVVLKVRYLQARIYLFRPILSHVCTTHRAQASDGPDTRQETESANNLRHRVALQCSLMCIKEAIDLIETMHANLTTAEAWGQKPSWLYGVLHIYLAATVLLAARLAPAALLTEFSEDNIQSAWKHALDILRGFQADSISAQRCVAALEILYRKLPGGGGHGEGTSGSSGSSIDTGGHSNTAQFDLATPLPLATDDILTFDGVQPVFEWAPDFDLSDPYDMSWFMVSESLP